MMPVQQVGTAKLPINEEEAKEALSVFMDEQFPGGYQLLYFSKEAPTEEDLQVLDSTPATATVN